jgi:microcystin-dependent protein
VPDSYTPILGMTLCEVGASRDTWGTKCNQNFSMLDSFVGYGMPIGMLADFAGSQPPSGWLVCDGRTVSRVTYAALFAVIGTLWGAGDGSTTFALPNLIGRSGVGPGSMVDQGGLSTTFTLAQATGYASLALQQAHLPNITLTTVAAGTHSHGGATAPGGNHTHSTDAQGDHAHTGYTDAQGDHAHSAWTDSQGYHDHRTTLPSQGAGAAAGPYNVMSTVFGNTAYTSDGSGSHGHNIGMNNAGNHQHNIQTYGGGSHGHNITYSGNLQLGIYQDGSHTHTLSLGGSATPLSVIGPILVVTKIIFAGSQAFASVSTASAVPTIDADEWLDIDVVEQLRMEIRDLRNEVARLRPHLGVGHVMRAPMRGTH